MKQTKKEKDKGSLLTTAVIIFLCAVFVGGFIWGLNDVLAMEGAFPPVDNIEGLTPPPETNEQVAAYLNKVITKALNEKPKTESGISFGIDTGSIETDGPDTMKETLKYLAGDFTSALESRSEKKSSDFFADCSEVVKVPAISADDIESFECKYIYYKCISCGETSDEPHDECTLCGSEYPYNMCYADDYEITVDLKNTQSVLNGSFNPRSYDEVLALIGDDTADTLTINGIKTDYSALTVFFRVNRLSDKLSYIEYKKDMPVETDITFSGDYASLGNANVKFNMTEKNVVNLTWPSLRLKNNYMTIEPKGNDNLLATLTCDDPTAYTVTWSSSDEDILTIDDEGYFKGGKKEGSAVVTASFEFGGITYSDECTVDVKYSVESLKMSKKNVKLSVGDTYELKVSVSPKNATIKTLKWYSEDESIATVDENGVVTAVGSGTVIIYALSDDGYFKSTSEVTVR